MSNEIIPPSEEVKSVRWRMNLPAEIVDAIITLAVGEERDPGAVAARWIKRYWKEKYQTEKEGASG